LGIVTDKRRIINTFVDILLWKMWKTVRLVFTVDIAIKNKLK